MTLGERLSALRGERSQAEVAAAAGMSRTQVSEHENGKRVPSLDVLRRHARALGVEPDSDEADALELEWFRLVRSEPERAAGP